MGTSTLVAVAALALVLVLLCRGLVGASAAPSAVTAQQTRGFLSAPRRIRLFDFNNVIIADERGTTEVDVIVVGRWRDSAGDPARDQSGHKRPGLPPPAAHLVERAVAQRAQDGSRVATSASPRVSIMPNQMSP